MTKHAPATPLPYLALSDAHSFGVYYVTRYGSEGAEECERLASISTKIVGQRGIAEYLAHSANAYPALVERVNRVAHWQPSVDDERLAKSAIDREIFEARALLRRLGEL